MMLSPPNSVYFIALIGALCLYIYVQHKSYQALSAEYLTLSTKIEAQNALIVKYKADVDAANKRARAKVKEVVSAGEELRAKYSVLGATAADMQAWWDSRRR